MQIAWSDGRTCAYPYRYLRLQCACAACVEEMTGRQILKVSAVPDDVIVVEWIRVGRYALQFLWSEFLWSARRTATPSSRPKPMGAISRFPFSRGMLLGRMTSQIGYGPTLERTTFETGSSKPASKTRHSLRHSRENGNLITAIHGRGYFRGSSEIGSQPRPAAADLTSRALSKAAEAFAISSTALSNAGRFMRDGDLNPLILRTY